MIKKFLFIHLFVLLLFTLSGCWDSRELNEIALASALAFDKEDDTIIVTAQVLNPGELASGQSGASGRVPVSSYQSSGKTVFEAIRKMTTELPRKLYLSHIQYIVFGEELAKEGIGDAIDFLSRDHEMRSDFFVSVSREVEAGEILNILSTLEKNPANKLYLSNQSSARNWGETTQTTIDELLINLMTHQTQTVLSVIIVSGDPNDGNDLSNVEKVQSDAKALYSGMAVFKEDRLIDWLDVYESRGVNLARGEIQSSIITIPCEEEGELAIEIIKGAAKTLVNKKREELEGTNEVNLQGRIGDVQCKTQLDTNKDIKKIEEDTSKVLKEEINRSIEKLQSLESDVIGFGQSYAQKYPQEWEKIKATWGTTFADMPIKINVKVKISNTGTTTNPLHNELEE
ncbi:Ger(x)C family spore germination protein [Aquibacillus albus]|uniref:Spore germination protein KC n=1 Tax=Aquibacillus albus TaxID=1168171 RepID=A0ABS2MY84_9BACI|nr:spore germination protein KC [Aquibacillus albus]